MVRTFQRRLWIVAAILAPAPALQAYLAGSWAYVLHSYSLGMLFGIISFVYFANTLIIAARIRYFDRLYGHDRVMVFHGWMAAAAVACASAHAVFKTLYYGLGTTQVNLGIAALAVFATVALATVLFMIESVLHRLRPLAALRDLCVQRLGFDYSRLKLFHNLTAAGMALALVHVLMAAPTAETRLRLALMGAWGGLSVLFYLRHAVLRPWLTYRNALPITHVDKPADDIVQLRAENPDGTLFPHRAGQFVYMRVLSEACGIEEHPFTIASPPGAASLRIVAKTLGNFSSALEKVRPGDKLLCDGPYGIFTPRRNAGPCIMIAGGIGITPFLSIIAEWNEAGIEQPVTLFWTVRRQADLVDDSLFVSAARRHPAFTYVPIVTREPGPAAGRLDRDLLLAHLDAGQLPRSEAYLCGPNRLHRAAFRLLRELGVPRKAIHYEEFSS